MKQEYKVVVEFPIKADAPDHALQMIRAYLEGKGIRTDGLLPIEHYIFIRPKEWK
jgi:hypothetical protein